MEELLTYLEQILREDITKLVISKPSSKSEEYKKIVVECKMDKYQIAKYTDRQVFHENMTKDSLALRIAELVHAHFLQVNAWSAEYEYMIMISKKGRCSYKKRLLKAAERKVTEQRTIGQTHNRKKNYIIEEGTIVPPLVDMGIFTAEGKVVHSMYDKFRQINRFIEIIDDAAGDLRAESINIIDFGCGKSYLTFILYYYLTEIKNIRANIIGLDLKADVIEKCNMAAVRYGYSGLQFELGDINGFEAPFAVDMVITLHACDTATDYALYNAIKWNAKMIFSVPCCQHELNKQIAPESLSILSHYGIIKERFAALATDAIRGELLEYVGYKTQLLEFVDFAHTPKNILIRAVRQPIVPKSVKNKTYAEINSLLGEFHFEPTLYRLLCEGGYIR